MPREPTLDQDGWEIDDGEAAHAESPETYWIPSLEARNAVGVGDSVKLRFYIRVEEEDGEIYDHGERMWVEIVGRVGTWFRGSLDNQPTCTDDIGPGFQVWFQPRHIIDIYAR